MRPLRFVALTSLVSLVSIATPGSRAVAQAASSNPNPIPTDPSEWKQHAMERPKPPVETAPAQSLPVAPPPGALVLFDGKDLSWWKMWDGSPAKWRLVDGAFEVVTRTGTMMTRVGFGDVKLHIEWMTPTPARGTGQDRANSGVFLMGIYEVQVLDSYSNDTYADGQAASLYGQFPPRVNVSRPPGEWQSFDIEFRRPEFDDAGRVTRPARVTVRHNGVLVHDDVALLGPTTNNRRGPYAKHEAQLPITLQDHGHPVRFRNVWVQPLASAAPAP